MKTAILLLFLLLSIGINAQQLPVFDNIASCFEKIRTGEADSLKQKLSDSIAGLLETVPFNAYNELTPVKYLGHKLCSNAEVELFAWSIPLTDGLAYYNIFRFKTGQHYLLKHTPGETDIVPPYLFYDLLAFKHEKENYFLLLGWAETAKTSKKIVQVARFLDNGAVNFTAPLLRKDDSSSSSLSFEYGKEVSMMLKHDKKGKRIIFDHLSPAEKRFEGYFMFYGPDATYNALILRKGEWWLRENVKP